MEWDFSSGEKANKYKNISLQHVVYYHNRNTEIFFSTSTNVIRFLEKIVFTSNIFQVNENIDFDLYRVFTNKMIQNHSQYQTELSLNIFL